MKQLVRAGQLWGTDLGDVDLIVGFTASGKCRRRVVMISHIHGSHDDYVVAYEYDTDLWDLMGDDTDWYMLSDSDGNAQ